MTEYRIGRPFSGYEYTTVEAESFDDALEMAGSFMTTPYWEFDPETHLLEEGNIWVRNTETLEDRTY